MTVSVLAFGVYYSQARKHVPYFLEFSKVKIQKTYPADKVSTHSISALSANQSKTSSLKPSPLRLSLLRLSLFGLANVANKKIMSNTPIMNSLLSAIFLSLLTKIAPIGNHA